MGEDEHRRKRGGCPVTFGLPQRFYERVENFDSYYRRTFPKLFFYAMRMTGDGESAADIAQESFVRCLQKYGEQNRETGLLFATARNLVLDGFRRRQRREIYRRAIEPENTDGPKIVEVRDEYQRVLHGLQQLDEGSRDILSLVVTSGLSYGDIAKMTGTTEANIKVKVHRARARLRLLLRDPATKPGEE